MNSRSWLSSLVLVTCSLLLFQNCTAPTDVDSDSALASAAATIDFAYDAKINEIGYMSCSTMAAGTYDTSAYFSLRAGAYDNNAVLGLSSDNGGLRATDAYLALEAKKPQTMQSALLTASPANSSTVMQLSIRHLGDLQNIASSSSSPVANRDYFNMLDGLDVSGVSTSIVALGSGQRLKYLTNGTVQGTRFEGSLYFTDSETLAASIRNYLKGDTYALGLTFTDQSATNSSPTSARSSKTVWPTTSTANTSRDVYGRGYHLQFMQPTGAQSAYDSTVLLSVSEQDFHTLTDRSAAWNCTDLAFKIIRPEDAAAQGCNKHADPLVPSKLLKIARNVLRYEDWYIDMDNMCIVTKKGGTGCYGANTYVQYDLSKACTPNPASNNQNVAANFACLAMASVCYKTTN